MQFVDVARKIDVHTLKCVVKLPKRYTYYIGQELYRLAAEIYTKARSANNIFAKDELSMKLRSKYLIEASCAVEALVGKLQILKEVIYANPEQAKWIDSALKTWGELLIQEEKLITGIQKSDKERQKDKDDKK